MTKSHSDSSGQDPLLPRIAAGEAWAVQALVDRYGRLIWSLARRQLGSQADDLVQEVFVELWRSAERFDPSRSSESTFVTMIARRRIIDLRRRASARPEEVDELAAAPEQADLEPVDARLEIEDEVRLARKALDRVSPDRRRVLELSLLEGLTHVEIAQTTEIPLGTVKSHLRRGLEEVRELLGNRGDRT